MIYKIDIKSNLKLNLDEQWSQLGNCLMIQFLKEINSKKNFWCYKIFNDLSWNFSKSEENLSFFHSPPLYPTIFLNPYSLVFNVPFTQKNLISTGVLTRG